MNHHLAALRVLLKQIDFDDLTFSLVPWPETTVPESMARAVARAGLLQPPLLRAGKSGFFQVIAGRKRLLAARQELSSAGCLCLVLPPETPELETLALALEAALASGSLTPVRRALFLRKAQSFLNQEQLAERFFPLLGLPSDARPAEHCRLLVLEENILQALHAGTLAEQTARELAELPFADRLALFEIIELLQLNVSLQKKLVDGCRELARLDHSSILDLVATPDVREILSHPATTPPQKTAKLMAWLQGIRPASPSTAEEEFLCFSRNLKLPASATLSPAPALGQDGIALTVAFPDRRVLAAAWPEIGAAIRKVMPR
jgi:ParB-like chromosome segregation protein Spo0J